MDAYQDGAFLCLEGRLNRLPDDLERQENHGFFCKFSRTQK